MSLRAYQQTATRTENPREMEYRLFGQVTRALLAASEAPADDIATRIDALDWNRRVWSALATDCSLPENTLPMQLRASIISLSLWVGRHSSAIMRKEEDFEPLIEINRMIMQGLAGRADGV
ncbi:flagellar biosynthesis regulator FlaF [Caulobacter soli]|uniref:flagellar biosynthesis regulator FlaF n=1 Tax=Caulobacter soli TaxID=2708539 RepID=UPI0013ECAA04|nr:flagellar biosynthesis regulator FlaF [Caulobacter soli]